MCQTYGVVKVEQDHGPPLEPCIQLMEDWNRATKHGAWHRKILYTYIFKAALRDLKTKL